MPWSRSPDPLPLNDLIFEIMVRIFGDPVHLTRARMIPKLSRTIAIHGCDSLEDLHEAIFAAFDRFDPHLWEFQIGGEKPFDKNGRRYVLPEAMTDDWTDPRPTAVAAETTIASLGLNKGERFFYWFDFGDDWWHRLDVKAVRRETENEQRLPHIIHSVGESPPQYPDFDDEENR